MRRRDILAAIGYPSFTAIVNGNRLGGAANEMVATLHLARMDAVRLNSVVTVCRSADARTCSDGPVWNSWITVADVDCDGAADDVLRVGEIAPAVELRVGSAIKDSRIVFRSDGLGAFADGRLLSASVAACLPTTRPADN